MVKANGDVYGKRTILLLGDNRISDSIIHALSADRSFTVHQLVRKQSSAQDNLTVTIHKTDFSPASLSNLFSTLRPDTAISTIAGGSHDTQKTIINAALETGVHRFIPAEFGQDSLNSSIQNRLPPFRERARTIAYLRKLSSSNRISWVATATGCSLDHGLQTGKLGFDLQWQSATMHGTGEERFAASSVNWIGRVVRSILKHWDDVADRYLYVAGTVTSANEVLQCLERLSGQQWEAGRGDVEDCVQEAERRIARGFPDAGMFLMERSVLYDESLGATRPFVEDDAKDLLGLKEESVEEIVNSVLHAHKHHGHSDCGCG